MRPFSFLLFCIAAIAMLFATVGCGPAQAPGGEPTAVVTTPAAATPQTKVIAERLAAAGCEPKQMALTMGQAIDELPSSLTLQLPAGWRTAFIDSMLASGLTEIRDEVSRIYAETFTAEELLAIEQFNKDHPRISERLIEVAPKIMAVSSKIGERHGRLAAEKLAQVERATK